MHLEHTVDVAAPPGVVWHILSDVLNWPEWTPTITHVEVLDPGELHVGQRAAIRQPRLPRATWEITAVEPGRSFTWETRMLAMNFVAGHTVLTRAGGSKVTLTLDISGIGSLLLRPVLASGSKRSVSVEAEQLKRRAEAMT